MRQNEKPGMLVLSASGKGSQEIFLRIAGGWEYRVNPILITLFHRKKPQMPTKKKRFKIYFKY
jgi:hypothetical protein